MIEQQIEIPTREGIISTFVCHPERNGPFPIILFYMDAPGIREELRDMARRYATSGYYVMLPNLYYRSGVMELGPMPEPDDVAKIAMITGLVKSLTISAIQEDTDALISFAASQPDASSGPIGCVGYCMSGQFAVGAAAHTGRVVASASIYGVSLVTGQPDSPHLLARNTTAELYFACAEIDHYAPLNESKKLKFELEKSALNAEVEFYWGLEHGFAFPSRSTYNKLAAERHWERVLALFRRHLT